jgi:hypothetical protein
MMTIPPDRSDSILPGQPIKPGPSPQAPATPFQPYMQEATQTPGGKGFAPAQGTAPLQGVQPFAPPQTAGPSLDTLIAQVGTSQDSLVNVREQLNTKNLALKRSQQHLVRNKLTDASTYLRAANNKLGVETPPMPSQSGARPIERFLNYVTDGENQLAAAQEKIMSMKDSGEQLRPGDLLLVQIKMSQAQQEIEYSSVLLSKVIDAIKATLNIAL